MFICLICWTTFSTSRKLASHVKNNHKLSIREYKEKFNLLYYCEVCGEEISHNKTNCCNHCRDRNGENNPFFNKTFSKDALERISSKNRIATTEKWKNEEYRSNIISKVSKPRREGFKEEQSARVIKWYKENPDQRDIRSIAMKNSWENGLIVKNEYSCNSSVIEKKLFEQLKQINESFEEKATLKINKKWFFPDIIDKERKLIIEYFGDYFHCNPKIYKEDYYNEKVNKTAKEIWEADKIRIEKFQNIGYTVIVVWADDFKENPTIIINQIKSHLT
jgi:G:T-mismatch repair DNA endonuclease (very short patch repair protein)